MNLERRTRAWLWKVTALLPIFGILLFVFGWFR
jgi:hypothetical protein